MKVMALVVGLVFLAVGVAAEESVAPSVPAESTQSAALETTLRDQKDVAVTVYNSDLALIRDTRRIRLVDGVQTLRFSDVAERIRPETVTLRSVSAPDALSIVEQNYEYDLMSPAKLMEKYVGRQVQLRNFDKNTNLDSFTSAELLSVNQSPIYRVDDKIYLGHPGNVVLPEVPPNLIAKPSLIWMLDGKAGEQTVEATYLTNGMEWWADYVLTLDKTEAKASLVGWVTLNNQSGAQYKNAQLKLVAGDRRLGPPHPVGSRDADGGRMYERPQDPKGMKPEGLGEYHLYTLPRRTTINQKQSKQVSLLKTGTFKVEKTYVYRPATDHIATGYYTAAKNTPDHIPVFYDFVNAGADGLGAPLPGGVIRVYQEDSAGALQFAGEDAVGHTAKNEGVRVKVGNAFDVLGGQDKVDFKQLGPKSAESTYEVWLRNHRDAAVPVEVIDSFQGDWNVIESTHEWKKLDAASMKVKVSVPKEGEVVIRYRVHVESK